MSTEVSIPECVYSVEKDFNQVNSYKMSFAKEAQFALQLLQGNDYLFKAAKSNPAALEYAIINLASIGISLNPALKEAYLVPRDNKICLDISYMGLLKLATDTGSIAWAQAEIVRKNDLFTFQGVGKAPVHQFDPFGERGEVVGVYCVARLSTGEFLTSIMTKKECEEIRDKASKASNGPWKAYPEEMMKKTVIKRASKLWPKSERIDTAVHVLNEHEGIDFNTTKGPHVDQSAYSAFTPSPEVFADIRKKLEEQDKSEKRIIQYVNTHFNMPKDAPLTALEDFGSEHIEYAYRLLGGSK